MYYKNYSKKSNCLFIITLFKKIFQPENECKNTRRLYTPGVFGTL